MYVDPEAFEWHESTLLETPQDDDAERPLLDRLEAMPSPMRDVVELIAFGRYSKAETARQLGLSEPWVHKLWKRARKELEDAYHADVAAVQDEDPVG